MTLRRILKMRLLKSEGSSAKNIMSSKELQEKVFREAKEHVQDNRGLLFSFNLVENTLKSISTFV